MVDTTVVGGTQVHIMVAEGTQAAIMAEDTQEVIMATQEVTITAMVTVTAMATVITAGMADGTVTTLTPGESRSMVIRAGGGHIRTSIPIILIHTGMLTRTHIRLSNRIILPHQRSSNNLPTSIRDSNPITGTARIQKAIIPTSKAVPAAGPRFHRM